MSHHAMQNYYFDAKKPLRPFTFSAGANPQSLAPRNALRVAPTMQDGYWPCEKEGAWVLIEDHREDVLYSTQTGERVEVTELGAVPEGLTDQARPDEDHVWDGKAWILPEEEIVAQEE